MSSHLVSSLRKQVPTMMSRRTWLAASYCSLLFACGTSDDGDEGFTESEQVPDPEITMQSARATSQIQIGQLALRTPIAPDVLRKVQDKLEKLVEREHEESSSAVAQPEPSSRKIGRASCRERV